MKSEKTYERQNLPQTLNDTIVFHSNRIIRSASFLKQKYDIEGLSIPELMNLTGFGGTAIRFALKAVGIKTRSGLFNSRKYKPKNNGTLYFDLMKSPSHNYRMKSAKGRFHFERRRREEVPWFRAMNISSLSR
ncbi:MAG: hypothetical protein HY390_06645 [Deltaproteobacteria bacterium]|nr:hypothetical protein [Deltaproteobacteria bacterium]